MKKQNTYAEKPYNRCLSCPHRKVRCDGPRTAGLTLDRWCEYMRDLKELNGLTNQDIAEASGISVKTIERLMAQDSSQDIRRETARLIENAIIGSSGKYPCYLAFEEEHSPNEQKLNEATLELERALADNKDYRVALDKIHDSYKAEMEVIRADAQQKIDYLLELVARLRTDNDNLWDEIKRKSKLLDILIDRQNALSDRSNVEQ